MVDLTAVVGSVTLPNPIMTAAGTAGHGTELHAYVDLSALGAHVVKSLASYPWEGNPPLRTHGTHGGMLNSVGLQGPGIDAWLRNDLPGLRDVGARVVCSIWGRSIDDYRQAAARLAGVDGVLAVEVNLSCPNTEAAGELLAHDPVAAAETVSATLDAGLPIWAKLSPNTDRVIEVAAAVQAAGADAVTLANTALGMGIDPVTGSYRIGSGPRGGGLSGPAVHPIAVRLVHDVHRALPDLPIIGAGGVLAGADAVEFLRAGACAVQVGTATFAEPRATGRVLGETEDLLDRIGIARLDDVIGVAGGSSS